MTLVALVPTVSTSTRTLLGSMEVFPSFLSFFETYDFPL